MSKYRFYRWKDAVLVVLLGGLFSACEKSPTSPEVPDVLPEILSAHVADNLNNVLSALVSIRTVNAKFVSVEIVRDSLTESTSPSLFVKNDSAVVPVLGLTAQRTYTLRTVAISSSGRKTYGPILTYVTRPLPNDIPPFRVTVSNSSSIRYVLLGINPARQGMSYSVIVNKNGTPVWYKQLPGGVFDFQKQADGTYTAWSSSGAMSPFQKLDILGNVTEEYAASNGLETGLHELRMNGSAYALFGVEYRVMDLSSYGGSSNTRVRGLVVEYHQAGQSPFLWNTFDHFSVTDAASDVSLTGSNVNPWHGNAIDIDVDGNLIVSFRNSDEITKIDSRTGNIIWRFGGKNNEFRILSDPLNGFSHQHGVRKLSSGNILMFDNGVMHQPPASRAVEYRIDESTKTAEMVWQYRPEPLLFASLQGFTQRLSNGNTLICFGSAQRVIEVDPNGTKLWELAIEETGRACYRAFSVSTLY